MFIYFPVFVFFGLFSFSVFATEESRIEVFFYSAPKSLDWSGPSPLLHSTISNYYGKVPRASTLSMEELVQLQNKLKEEENRFARGASDPDSHPHPISHADIAVQCEGDREYFLGMTGALSYGDYLSSYLFEGASMETMIENTPGLYIDPEYSRGWLPRLKNAKQVNSLRYNVKKETCQKLVAYLKDYTRIGVQKIYGGLGNDPLKGTGAGCSAFVMSALKVAGLYEKEFDNRFRRKIRIPMELLGLNGEKAKYGFIAVYFGNWSRWAAAKEAGLNVTFWDPQLMFNWVENIASGGIRWNTSHKIIRQGNFTTIAVNATGKEPPQSFVFSSAHVKRIKKEIERVWRE